MDPWGFVGVVAMPGSAQTGASAAKQEVVPPAPLRLRLRTGRSS